ncbi:MAG TPA: Hsp20/alpha crystallin family protein, partial [Cyclobacteriaceae bacterium]|nr:Hsp20/alpha crystallin family protein [Cyclobacteriaceae bacterium]
ANIVSDEIIQTIDIANTLQGGISEPMVRLTRFPEYRQIELRVPGIGEDNMHVKINNNQLLVFYNHLIESRGQVIAVPHFVYNKPIPYFIDANKIKATYEDNVLTVQLPYNELANGFHRDIPIES